MKFQGPLLVLLSVCLGIALADTPANCTYDDVVGQWTLYEGAKSGSEEINCTNSNNLQNKIKITLSFPDIAYDQYGRRGYWTLIYNQGFEIEINYRKYFAFSSYKTDAQGNVTSFCGDTLPGWSHDILGHNWACYKAVKDTPVPPKVHQDQLFNKLQGTFRHDNHFIRNINQVQSSWKAKVYPELKGLSHEKLLKRNGGRASRILSIPHPFPATENAKKMARNLPESFDWRNVNGENFVSPVRNQGGCGSCYSFSSVGMIESRLQVLTNNTIQIQLSPQDIVSCSEYSQGCEGGFPYLIAGKYSQDFGMVEESCYPYEGQDDACKKNKCPRHYAASYKYVGGFYGGCNEEWMKIALVQNGPLSVSFEVYPDFTNYQGGIYHHTGLRDGFNPFYITNHAVLLVGYGQDSQSGEKYWIVKNSWGETWGESGFFRIRRGTNECSIESIAVEAFPIP